MRSKAKPMGLTSLAAYGRSSGRSIAGTPFALPPSNLQARFIEHH